MPTAQHSRVRLGIFTQRLVTAHDMAVEFERTFGHKTSRPSFRILRVNCLAIARAIPG